MTSAAAPDGSRLPGAATTLAARGFSPDMDTGAVVAVTLDGGTAGDTTTLEGTLAAAEQNLEDAREYAGEDSKRTHEPSEVVADKAYHSKMVMLTLQLGGWRSYIAEPRRG